MIPPDSRYSRHIIQAIAPGNQTWQADARWKTPPTIYTYLLWIALFFPDFFLSHNPPLRYFPSSKVISPMFTYTYTYVYINIYIYMYIYIYLCVCVFVPSSMSHMFSIDIHRGFPISHPSLSWQVVK